MANISADADLSAIDPYEYWGSGWTFPYPYSAGVPTDAPISLSAGSTWAIRSNVNDFSLNPHNGYAVFECEQGQWVRQFMRSVSGTTTFAPWIKTADYFSGSTGVTSVNGQTGDVSISAAIVLPVTLQVTGS